MVVPADLAYAEAGSPPAIGPNQVLTFEVELVAITRDNVKHELPEPKKTEL